jgi:sulfite reductase alpha subunit-like flavoprotein
LENRLSGLSFAIMAFGNSSFENHCGFGLKTQKFLKAGGGKEILDITLCDASSKEKDSDARYPEWSSKLM